MGRGEDLWRAAQDLKAADDLSSHQMTQLSPDKKTETNHSKTEILLQLAQWKAIKGQGDQNEITGTRRCIAGPKL